MSRTSYSKADSSKKTILIFHPALAPYRVDFFNSLNSEFNAHFYFLFPNVPTQKFNQTELQKDCEFKCNYLESGYDFFRKSFRFGLIKNIIKINPDIILCSEYGPLTFLLFFYFKLYNKKFKLYSLSDDSLDLSIKRKGFRAFARNFICRNIDGVIFNSVEVAKWHKDNISKNMKELVLPIVHKDDSFRFKLSKSIPVANEKITTNNLQNKSVILYVGRLEKVKNIDFLIDCFIDANIANCVLVLVGAGSKRVSLEKRVREETNVNKVIFTGRLEGKELLSWYLIADLFILPSTYEPFGAVTNEALLAGCYVLCSENAGASTLITETNGALFNPLLQSDLTEKIKEYLNRCEPINSNLKRLRDNKMPFSFDDKINLLINNLD